MTIDPYEIFFFRESATYRTRGYRAEKGKPDTTGDEVGRIRAKTSRGALKSRRAQKKKKKNSHEARIRRAGVDLGERRTLRQCEILPRAGRLAPNGESGRFRPLDGGARGASRRRTALPMEEDNGVGRYAGR